MVSEQDAVDRHFRVGHVVEPEPYDTARDIWRALDPVDERWTRRPARQCEWIFRGQSDAEWGLAPSAWRSNGEAAELVDRARKRCVRRRGDVPRPWKLQTLAEQQLMQDFIAVAEREGIELPPDTPRSDGRSQRHLEVVTLAQHYGVPTGLLDFTRDPTVALFWAIHCDELSDEGDLAVWALFGKGWEVGLSLHQHAKARNRHLLAQDGVTVEMTMADHFLNVEGRLPGLEECASFAETDIVKLTLPRSEVPELRRLLEVRGVTLARLMPGYSSVARTAMAWLL